MNDEGRINILHIDIETMKLKLQNCETSLDLMRERLILMEKENHELRGHVTSLKLKVQLAEKKQQGK